MWSSPVSRNVPPSLESNSYQPRRPDSFPLSSHYDSIPRRRKRIFNLRFVLLLGMRAREAQRPDELTLDKQLGYFSCRHHLRCGKGWVSVDKPLALNILSIMFTKKIRNPCTLFLTQQQIKHTSSSGRTKTKFLPSVSHFVLNFQVPANDPSLISDTFLEEASIACSRTKTTLRLEGGKGTPGAKGVGMLVSCRTRHKVHNKRLLNKRPNSQILAKFKSD